MALPCPVYTIYRWSSVMLLALGTIQFSLWTRDDPKPSTSQLYWLVTFMGLRMGPTIVHGIMSMVFLLPATYWQGIGWGVLHDMFRNSRNYFYERVDICTAYCVVWVIFSWVTLIMLVLTQQPPSLWALECIQLVWWIYVMTLRLLARRLGTTRQWFTLRWTQPPIRPVPRARLRRYVSSAPVSVVVPPVPIGTGGTVPIGTGGTVPIGTPAGVRREGEATLAAVVVEPVPFTIRIDAPTPPVPAKQALRA